MKRLIVNLTDTGRNVNSEAKLNKQVIRKIYWFFEPVGSDNTPLAKLPKAHRAGFGPNSASRGMYLTDSEGVCKHNRFRLSVCGLDKFRVTVSLKRDGSGKKTDETYEVWRRVYFSVRTMHSVFLFGFGPIHTEYRKHGIWPEEIPPKGGKLVPYTKFMETREGGLNLVQEVTSPKASGLEARIVLVDRLWISGWRGTKGSASKASAKISYSDYVWPEGDFISGTVEGRDIRKFATRAGKTVKFDFSSSDVLTKKIAAGDKLKLDFRVKLATKILNGTARSATGKIVIATRTGLSDTFREVAPRQGTMIHEMGHGLGMVVKTLAEYDAATGKQISSAINPSYYANGGGHCSTGATGSAPSFVKGNCVMYHAGHSARPHDFCGSCAPIVKRNDLTRSKMKWP